MLPCKVSKLPGGTVILPEKLVLLVKVFNCVCILDVTPSKKDTSIGDIVEKFADILPVKVRVLPKGIVALPLKVALLVLIWVCIADVTPSK